MSELERHRPRFTAVQAEALASEYFGHSGRATALPSERDQNFLLTSPTDAKAILKISNSAEKREVLDFQNQAMAHLSDHFNPNLFPQVLPGRDGETIGIVRDTRERSFRIRLLTFVDGLPLVDFSPHTRQLFRDLGRFLGRMDEALTSLDYTPPARTLVWDLDRASSVISQNMAFIDEPGSREMVARFLDLFQSRVSPRLSQLRTSVIHNDANDHNVLISTDEKIAGIIDFGDMLHSYTVYDLAVALSYAMLAKVDPLPIGAEIVAGYHDRMSLSELEVELLYPMVAIRLCTSVSLSAARRGQAPDRNYLTVTEKPAWALLEQLQEIGPDFTHYLFRAACNMAPCPKSQAIVKWISQNASRVAPVVSRDLERTVTCDLGVGSLELGSVDHFSDTSRLEAYLFGRMMSANAEIGIGRYGEVRPIYRSETFRVATDEGEEWRTLHLGIDLFVQPGTAVHAPLKGIVHSFADNKERLDYGPTIILEHGSGADTFYTLYGHLDRESLENIQPGMTVQPGQPFAAVGDSSVNGGWPPHLHFQIIIDMLGRRGEFPGVARPSQQKMWLSISPDPRLLLPGLSCETSRLAMENSQLLELRHQHLSESLSLSYRRPLKIVRGWKQYLYDDLAQRYLDCVNNVCHVGHCHPHVVKAIQKQAAVLNTNTRYLHDNIVRYARRLCATLPEPLTVCFFVCSGSEANELALRLARTHTGQLDTIVLEGAYHGNTSALIDISPYKHEGPGGKGPPPHVHAIPMPDPYRGRYRAGSGVIANHYAKHVEVAISGIRSGGRGLAALICEPLLSCGGQIVLPEGFLKQAFHYVRSNGGVCIADEVQVGFGRVGTHFWGFETQDVVPDIVTMGKPIGNGHPLAAVVTTPEIAASFANGMEYFNTFGGNPVSCAAGMAVLDVIEQESLQENARDVGAHLKQHLMFLKEKHSLIGDVRGLGLFLGVELVTDLETKAPATAEAKYVIERMRDHGILLSTDGPDNNVLKIKPPLIFTARDADRLVNTLDTILSESKFSRYRPYSSSNITGS